jgi:hypothetical protein
MSDEDPELWAVALRQDLLNSARTLRAIASASLGEAGPGGCARYSTPRGSVPSCFGTSQRWKCGARSPMKCSVSTM